MSTAKQNDTQPVAEDSDMYMTGPKGIINVSAADRKAEAEEKQKAAEAIIRTQTRRRPRTNPTDDAMYQDDTWQPPVAPPQGGSVEELSKYIDERMRERADSVALFVSVGRRTFLQNYVIGQAMMMVRGQLKEEGAWVKWQEERGYSRMTVHRYIKHYEKYSKRPDPIAALQELPAKKAAGLNEMLESTADEPSTQKGKKTETQKVLAYVDKTADTLIRIVGGIKAGHLKKKKDREHVRSKMADLRKLLEDIEAMTSEQAPKEEAA